MSDAPFRATLQALYHQAGYQSLGKLANAAHISSWYLYRLERGLLANVPTGVMVKLAIALGIPLGDLVAALSNKPINLPPAQTNQRDREQEREIKSLKQEYDRLERQLAAQAENLREQWQRQALEILEPWLLQWPTAAANAQQNPHWPAHKLLPLTRPLTNLLNHWHIEAIAMVGEITEYDPQWQEFIGEGATPTPGEMVEVRYVGYRRGQDLLYRVKVKRPQCPPNQVI